MDWENETYVRFYVRDTITWLSWPWEARCVFGLLLRKLDRAGVLDLSGSDPIDAVAAVAMLPREFVTIGLPPLLKSETVIVDGTRLVAPNYIPAQESSSSNAQRARLFRSKARAVEALIRNEDREPIHQEAEKLVSTKEPVKGTQRNESLRDRNESLRKRNAPPVARNSTLHSTTPRNTEREANASPPSPNAVRVAEAKKASLKRRRGKRGTIRVELDGRQSDPSLFALAPEERKALDAILSSSTGADAGKRNKLEERIEEEILRVYRYQRHRATGIDFPLLRGKDAQKWRSAARKFGCLCIAYGMTPESVFVHWAEHNWTEQKYPTLMWLAGPTQMDQAAMAILPSRGPSRKKGPKEAVDGKDWEDFGDDFETLVGSHPDKGRGRDVASAKRRS